MSRLGWLRAAVALAALLFAVVLFKHLSYPLLWHDESETAIFARRVLEVGFPKVHGERNVVYSLWQKGGVGIHEATDAYTGSPWGQYYFGAIGMWLAGASDDLYTRTALMRLPFAAIGALGLALLAAAVWPSLGSARQRWGFTGGYLLALSYSVLLILHLREARHYALTIFWVGAILFVFFRRQVFGTLGLRAYALWTSALLFALFNTFFPAFTILLIAMGVTLLVRNRSAPRDLLREGFPLLLGGLSVVPLLGFFDFLGQTRGWVARFGEPGLYLDNLGFVLSTLFRFEWLAPALVLRFTVASLSRPADDPGGTALGQRREIASFLLLLVASWALFVAQAPFLFERYFIATSPLLTLAALLDAFSLAELRAGRISAFGRRVSVAGAALALATVAVGVLIRAPDFAGRLHEIRHRYRGPLDFVIPHLAETHPAARDLVIATNYEGPAYMVYLDSRVTVGFYGADLERDLLSVPDVIVPRPWPDQLEVLEQLAARASYDQTSFPVQNLRWNNSPALSPRADHPTAHRFETPLPSEGAPQLVILERRR